MNKILYIATLLVSLLFIGCSKSNDEPSVPKDTTAVRTVIMYVVADNSIAAYLGKDVAELIQGVKASTVMTENDHLVLMYNTASFSNVYDLTKAACDTLTTIKNLTPAYVISQDENVCTKEVFGEVLNLVKTEFPAQSYSLVMESHGSGWVIDNSQTAASTKQRRSIGKDGSQTLDVTDLAEVLATPIRTDGKKNFDFIFFDACFMQGVEVCYQLRNVADYIVASPAEIPGDGAAYDKMVDCFFTEGEAGATMVADQYYKTYVTATSGPLLSVVKTDALDAFADYMQGVVSSHHNEIIDTDYSEDNNYYCFGVTNLRHTYPDYNDIKKIMQNVLTSDELQTFNQQLSKVITSNPHSNAWLTIHYINSYGQTRNVVEESYSGMSMFIPFPKYDLYQKTWNTTYRQLDWGQKVWPE